jgi:chromosomal replication initiator protein
MFAEWDFGRRFFQAVASDSLGKGPVLMSVSPPTWKKRSTGAKQGNPSRSTGQGLSLQGSFQEALNQLRTEVSPLAEAPISANTPHPLELSHATQAGSAGLETPSPYADLWQGVQQLLSESMSPPSFQTWIRPLRLAEVRFQPDETVTVKLVATSDFTRGYVKNHYHGLIQKAFQTLLDAQAVTLEWELADAPEEALPPAMVQARANETAERLLEQESKLKSAEKSQPWTPRTLASGLQPRYTFEQFVVGPFNHFAHAAALAIAEQPGIAYNPFFIHGSVGLGKTHLIQAIGHYALRHHPNLTVRYVTTETFTNDLIQSIATKRMNEFRDRYRKIDLLIVDDIQFLEGKEKTQEEIFHTFNALHGLSKQVILSSDRPPKALARLEERLVSRFEWGLIVDIQLPDLEARKAILRKKAEREGMTLRFHLDDEVMTYLAEQSPHNIRELEGHFNKLAAVCLLEDKPFNMTTVEAVFGQPQHRNRLDEHLILALVQEMSGVSVKELKGPHRAKEVAHARQLAIYACREWLDLSFPKIGKIFGRQHSTILYSYEKLKEQLSNNSVLKKEVELLMQKCQNQCY